MPKTDPDADKLSQEWRKMVIDALNKVQDDLDELKESTSAAAMATSKDVDSRLRKLEDFKLKTITVLCVIQMIFLALMKFWK